MSAPQQQVLELTAASQQSRQQHAAILLDLEAKKISATLDVPTLPDQVRAALRQLGLPVRLFGENLANVRDRLRLELARRQVGAVEADLRLVKEQEVEEEEEEEVVKYTRASPNLVQARQAIATFSLQRAAKRLEHERKLRSLAIQRKRKAKLLDDDTKQEAANELTRLDDTCLKLYKTLRQTALEGSQYGDSRALSSLCAGQVGGIPLVATASWTGTVHLWDASSSLLQNMGQKTMCHEDRIMGIAMQVMDNHDEALMATTSIDMTGKVWKVQKSNVVMAESDEADESSTSAFSITEQAHLQGHAARLCRAAFHPMKRHVATTSFDHTWRLWDIETGENLLLQDGHVKECYGVGFHIDGSLCATTDYASVVHVWDLRTGKSIHHFLGHAKRVLNAEFHPNGFQLATSGDDGTIKIWDLRRRKLQVSLPAHLNIVTKLQFDPSGEYLASSSFDGTVKLWGCRDFKMLNEMLGHEGQVSGVDILENHSIVSCGFDKTLKLWS